MHLKTPVIFFFAGVYFFVMLNFFIKSVDKIRNSYIIELSGGEAMEIEKSDIEWLITTVLMVLLAFKPMIPKIKKPSKKHRKRKKKR